MTLNDKARVTIIRECTGHFSVKLDGQPTDWRIVNGSQGLSGRDTRNMYGIVNDRTEVRRWLGPLATCKKVVTATVLRDAGVSR